MNLYNFKVNFDKDNNKSYNRYGSYVSSLIMLDKLRLVKPIVSDDVTMVYILENHLSHLNRVDHDAIAELSTLYNKHIQTFILTKLYGHIINIFNYWYTYNNKYEASQVKESTLENIKEFNSVPNVGHTEHTFEDITFRLSVAMKHQNTLIGNYVVVPKEILNTLQNKIHSVINNKTLSYEHLHTVINVIDILVHLKGEEINDEPVNYNSNCYPTESNQTKLHINSKLAENINGRSHLSLETVICMTPQVMYHGLSKGRYDDKSDSILFLRGSEVFNEIIRSRLKKNYNTMSFGTETDR